MGGNRKADWEPMLQAAKDHPNIELTEDPQKADFVLQHVFGDSYKDARLPSGIDPTKVALIDLSDGPQVVPYIDQQSYRAVFKRSYVRKTDGVYQVVASGCGSNCYPFGYGIVEKDIAELDPSRIGDASSRHTPVLCTLRPWTTKNNPENLVRQVGSSRNRVIWWLKHGKLPQGSSLDSLNNDGYASFARIPEANISFVRIQEADRTMSGFEFNNIMSPAYKAKLHDVLIAVTANPASYEGDHRFWEHLAAGNAIISDEMWTPLPFPMIPGEHYEQFDIRDMPGNEAAFHQKINTMLKDVDKTREMACKGTQHALKHHRVINRLDYVVRTMAKITNAEDYQETGPDLKKRLQEPKQTDIDYGRNVLAKKASEFSYNN